MKIMEYAFNLTWNEISKDLKVRKINEVVEFWEENDKDFEMNQPEIIKRQNAEKYIRAHFPIYF